jgi:glycosyltransferase involved in cell wall biosynthesis
LSGTKSAGPNHSVPKQIKAQAKYDNVLWLNINNLPKEQWDVEVNFVNTTSFPKLSVDQLPKPFNRPDVVVFESVYYLPYCKIAKELKKNSLPYIVIPRSSLTFAAQHSKALKKKLGNMLLFNKFVKNATAIQYLTNSEYIASGKRWNKNTIIIPNGVDIKTKTKIWSKKEGLKGVYIGRMDIYQKGLDLLIEACSLLKDKMKAANCTITLHGPERNGAKAVLNELITKKGLDDLVCIKDGIYDADKEAVLLDSDFFIMTSRFEGHPMALIEALSYGLPCVVTTGTNMAEEIALADAGWTAGINLDSVVQALKDALKDKRKFAIKGVNAINLAKHYDWDQLAKISSEKYRAIVAGGNDYLD